MPDESAISKMCPHCGAVGSARLGRCCVCDLTVCERCGNVQFIQGERHLVHDECLSKKSDSFSMIRFVR